MLAQGDCTPHSQAFATASPSQKLAAPIPTTPNGSAISPSATTRSATCWAPGRLQRRRQAYRNGMTIRQKLAARSRQRRMAARSLRQPQQDRRRAAARATSTPPTGLSQRHDHPPETRRAIPTTPNGSAISPSATRGSATCCAQGELQAAAGASARHDHPQAPRRADPGNAEWQRDLSVSHTALGDLLTKLGDREAALAAYRAGLAIDERLAAADLQNAEWQRDLLISLVQIARWLLQAGDREAACPMARRVDVQARLLAERFTRTASRTTTFVGGELLAQARGPAA